MTQGSIPRILIAAAGSGSGKTMITCALLEVLRRRGLPLRACKCGPDYIDPMFHRKVLGIESRNLDSYFMNADGILDALRRYPDECAVIEGVMGIYDGLDAGSKDGSCYEIAKISDTPVLLVVDASGVGRTVISQIKGILADDRYGLIQGILLNKISEVFYEKLFPVLKVELKNAGHEKIHILGGIPEIQGVGIGSRHLGLKLPDEVEDLKEKIARFADVLEDRCDIGTIVEMMESASQVSCHEEGSSKTSLPNKNTSDAPVIAIARDEAFCFYYEENIEALQKAGACITYFSPIHDRCLPEGTSGLVLGGGYPELYLKELSGNTALLDSIRAAISQGMPVIAECGGFLYLHRTVKDQNGMDYSLAGAIDDECFYTDHLVRFGYMQITADNSSDPKAFGISLNGIKGHEFHYYDSTRNGEDCTAVKPTTGKTWKCMMAGENRLWGFPHLYYPSCEGLTEGFVRVAGAYQRYVMR